MKKINKINLLFLLKVTSNKNTLLYQRRKNHVSSNEKTKQKKSRRILLQKTIE